MWIGSYALKGHTSRVSAVYLSFAIQADALVVKVTPHFGQRT